MGGQIRESSDLTRASVHKRVPFVISLLLLAAASCGVGGSPAVSQPDPAGFRRSDLVDILAPDDIRPVTKPAFETIAQAGAWLTGGSPVIAVVTEAGARAYPLAIMVAHEVVDDVIGDVPIAVTYSPLTNAAVVFDRRAAGQTLELGTAGKVLQSDLVLYDHQTKSLWWQISAVSILGSLKARTLRVIGSAIVSFADFTSSYPDGHVLSRPTESTYTFTPYPGYDSRATPYRGFFRGKLDGRMPAMRRVVGVVAEGIARAYPFDRLAAAGDPAVVQEEDRVIFWGGKAVSPLDAQTIAESTQVGSSGAFRPAAGGHTLHFRVRDGVIVDRETGSVWTLLGRARSGPLKGTQLEIIPHLDAFWFSWASWQPDTTIWQPSAA
jgi:hypothetical protein